ncbi:MAG: SH3 domain-containing protein [Legionellales bacterium]|nr:SH3 domain-containing protein [Legionellales bacterium]
MMKKLFSLTLTSTCLIAASSLALANAPAAKTLSLHTNPDAKSAVVSQIKPTQTLVEIFQKNGWVKVGNPENGDTGWIKASDLNASTQQQVTQQKLIIPHFSQTIITAVTDKNGHTTYKVEQSNDQKKISQKEAADLFKHIQEQQTQFQAHMQQLMNESFATFNDPFFTQAFPHVFNPQPVQIVVVPPNNHVTITPETKKAADKQ